MRTERATETLKHSDDRLPLEPTRRGVVRNGREESVAGIMRQGVEPVAAGADAGREERGIDEG